MRAAPSGLQIYSVAEGCRVAGGGVSAVAMGAKYATLADVAKIVREARWLIRGWLPRGYVTVLFGHPEKGKTCLAIHTLRQLFLGESWPDGETCERINSAVWVDTEAAHSNLCEKAAAWAYRWIALSWPLRKKIRCANSD